MINEEEVKNAFKRVKVDILRLEAELKQNRGVLSEIKRLIEALTIAKKDKNIEIDPPISYGHSNIQSNEQSNKQTIKPLNIQSDIQSNINFEDIAPREASQEQILTKKEPFSDLQSIEKGLLTLTKQEFRIFLLIYQLEEQGSIPNYRILEDKLSLTSGCLRSYISSIISKGAPIMKKRLRNNSINLAISPSFRSLTSTQKLINLYYKSIDPSQTHLSNQF